MGAAINYTSNYTQQTITSFNEMISTFSTNLVNNAGVETGSIQRAVIYTGSSPYSPNCAEYTNFSGSNIKLGQKLNVNTSLTTKILNKVQNTSENLLSEKIDQWITNNITQNAGWLSIALNIAKTKNINQTDISNMISTNISTNISNVCAASVDTKQTIELFFCGNYINTNVDLSQKAAITQLASCIYDNTIQNIVNNSVILDIVQQTDNEIAQNAGFNWYWLLAAFVIISIIGLIGKVLTSGSSSKQQDYGYDYQNSYSGGEYGD